MQEVTSWIEASGMSRAEVARRSGLAYTTLHRIERGEVSPTIASLDEIAAACGLRLRVVGADESDPAAAEAARVHLEVAYSPTYPDRAAKWHERLARMVGTAEPVPYLIAAAHAASPARRHDALIVHGNFTASAIAAAGDATGHAYALSGAASFDITGHPGILWAEKPDAAARFLTNTARRSRGDISGAIILPAYKAVFTDAYTGGPGLIYVAPIQQLLDCIGLGGALEEAAIAEAKRW